MYSNKHIQINYEIEESSIKINIYNKIPVETEQVVEITNENNALIYRFIIEKVTDEFINDGLFHFCSINNSSKDINVKIYEKGILTFQELIKIRNKYKRLILQPTIVVGPACGLGDSYCAQPIIRKLNKIFDRRIDVYCKWSQPFINNPYVNNFTKLYNKNSDLYDKVKQKNKNNPNFWEIIDWNNPKSNAFTRDIRNVASINCGIHLDKNEKHFDFYPNPQKIKYNLPEKYILIYPRIAGIDRDFGKDKWQKLVDSLNSKNIPVVIIGLDNWDNKKDYYDLNVNLGINLCGKIDNGNLNEFDISSEMWHIVNNAFGIITFPTSIFVIAATTKTNIFLIESYFNNDFFNPHRQGGEDYKFFRIHGECLEKCISNPKYYIEENAEMSQFKRCTCPLSRNFSCIPTVEEIVKTVVKEYYA